MFGNMLKQAMMTPREVHDSVLSQHKPGLGTIFGTGIGATAGLGFGATTGLGVGKLIGPKTATILAILGGIGGAAGGSRLGYGLGSMADEQAAKDAAMALMLAEQSNPGITQRGGSWS